MSLESNTKTITMNGIPIKNLRYADDTTILADNIEELQAIVNAINPNTWVTKGQKDRGLRNVDPEKTT